MLGQADREIRIAAFEWLSRQRDVQGEALPRQSLEEFSFRGRGIPLVGPSGIWKPAACDLPISITTVLNSQYKDSIDESDDRVSYAYRGIDPLHRDNRGLRTAMLQRVPLIYFYAIEPGRYAAAYPVFVVADDQSALRFTIQVDDLATTISALDDTSIYAEAGAEPRRAYVTATVQRRVHQVAFRERVIRAYAERCALCRLRHRELLDAAHITPDRDELGKPVVRNGLALCKLHHAAFDRFFFTIRPDYTVEVRPSVLMESDGPMLVVGLQQINGQAIHVPARVIDRPDRDRLERRLVEFQQAVRTL